jgi:hypothetical protein
MFKDELEQCQTSAEFLLDPWVLMQLPWNPVLLMQWTAGVLTEYYSLRFEMVELLRWFLPLRPSRVVRKLFSLLSQMPLYLLKALHHMEMHFKTRSKMFILERAGSFLNMLTHELLPLLEFVVLGKARDIARALKRMSFGSNFHMSKENIRVLNSNFEWEDTYNCLFSNLFWLQGDSNKVIGTYIVGTSAEQIKKSGVNVSLGGCDEFREKDTPQWIAEMETKYGKEIEKDKVTYTLHTSGVYILCVCA